MELIIFCKLNVSHNLYTHSHTLTHTSVDMVDAWMKMKDNVFGQSGEPTWTSLDKALRSIKQTSVADKIKSDIGIYGCISIVLGGGVTKD